MNGKKRAEWIDIVDDIDVRDDPKADLLLMAVQARMLIECAHQIYRVSTHQEHEADALKELAKVIHDELDKEEEEEEGSTH